MKDKPEKAFIKIVVPLISVFGITAIGIGSTLALPPEPGVECVQYNRDRREIKRKIYSMDYCNSLVKKGTAKNGSYWVNEGPVNR